MSEEEEEDFEEVRIAMWSGPRNISTAMMRAFENRPDASVIDEPFYAVYLDRTGADHPMREESLASQSTNWREVVAELLAAGGEKEAEEKSWVGRVGKGV